MSKRYIPDKEKKLLDSKSKYISKDLKNKVWLDTFSLEQGYPICPVCYRKDKNLHLALETSFNICHITPLSQEGETTYNNLVPCCTECYSYMKGSKYPLIKFIEDNYPSNKNRFNLIINMKKNNIEQLFQEILSRIYNTKYYSSTIQGSINVRKYTCKCGIIITEHFIDMNKGEIRWDIDLEDKDELKQIILSHYTCVSI